MIKGRFEPQRRKTEPVSKTYKYVGRFIDLSYVCQKLADGCKVCKKEISLAHYEDETVIGLASILHFHSERLSTIGMHEEIIKGV